MKREEAIRILDPETTAEALAEIEYYAGFRGKEAAIKAVEDACILAVAALREQEERRWIPVSERLPEESGMYIVTANDGHAQRVSFVLWQKRNRMWSLTGARSYWGLRIGNRCHSRRKENDYGKVQV